MNSPHEMKRTRNNFAMSKKDKYSEDIDEALGIVGTGIATLSANNRKSSAEIVSEAKSMLTGGGVRLVTTRRPVTPRDPRRQLYGAKLAPPGRPPSSFSLRYLQFESGKPLPPLKPIYQQSSPPSEQNEDDDDENMVLRFRRSGSVGTLLDNEDPYLVLPDAKNNPKSSTSLLAPIKASADFLNAKNNFDTTAINIHEDQEKYMELQHPFWQRQTRSFDLPLKPSERIAVYEFNKEDENNEKKNENIVMNKTSYLSGSHSYNNFDGSGADIENLKDNDEYNFETNNIMINSSRARLLVRSNLLSQSTTDTLLDLLKAHSGIKDCSDETVQHINAILVELYTRVKGATKGEWRGAILGGLYGLVECTSPKILLAVARVVLALSVTGSNLTGACKLVFKVARNEQNDHFFFETDIPELLIDGLGRASPLEDPEACIYGYGAVRFLFNASLNMNQQQSSFNNLNNNNNINNSNTNNNKNNNKNNNNNNNNINKKILNNDQNINKKQKTSLALRLSKAGAIQLMVLHLQILNEAGAEKSLIGQPLHALYQLSAALRALAGIPQIYFENGIQSNMNNGVSSSGGRENDYNNQKQRNNKNLDTHEENENNINYNENLTQHVGSSALTNETNLNKNINLELACPHLVKAAEISLEESEIQTNIVRTLSVLSDHDVCCKALADYVGRIGMLLGPCYVNRSNHLVPDKPLGLLSRLGYILGNIMARFDSARLQFYHNDVAIEYLLNTLDAYSKQNFSTPNQNDDTVVEVLIKLIRVIANMSVNADVGYGIGSKPLLGQVLLRMLMKINQMTSEELTDEIEELLQAILGAMHNLCFYQDQTSIDKDDATEKEIIEVNNHELTSMNELIPELSIALCNTLTTGSNQIKAETSRVLGNMTRNSIARDAFCTAGGLNIILQCLKSDDYELKSTCSGVLVNLLGDWERRIPFNEMCGPLILNDILEKSANQSDWILAGIVCQAFWNYLIDSCNVVNALGEIETDKILAQLVEYLDEEKIFKGKPPDFIWEQFASVATDLLERIQSSLEQGSLIDNNELNLQIDRLENDTMLERKFNRNKFC